VAGNHADPTPLNWQETEAGKMIYLLAIAMMLTMLVATGLGLAEEADRKKAVKVRRRF
jgi:hypothetical protein